MIKEGRLLVCDRCGRTEFKEGNKCETYKWNGAWWTLISGEDNGKSLCPACKALLESVTESIIQGKSVSIPELEHRPIGSESVEK